jgi:hypothetical protein
MLIVYQPTSTVAKDNIDLLRFKNGRDLAMTKYAVFHSLAAAIFSRPVIRSRRPAFSNAHSRFDAARE